MELKPSSKLFQQLRDIEELDYVLRNWCQDDDRKPGSYTLDELIVLARWRVEEFEEPGHSLNDGLTGEHGLTGDAAAEEEFYCRTQYRLCKQWLKRAEREYKAACNDPAVG